VCGVGAFLGWFKEDGKFLGSLGGHSGLVELLAWAYEVFLGKNWKARSYLAPVSYFIPQK
jgi:hypothetical protein